MLQVSEDIQKKETVEIPIIRYFDMAYAGLKLKMLIDQRRRRRC